MATSDYARILQSLAERNLAGGIVFDALLLSAARNARADSLLTFNPKDLRRLWQDGDTGIVEP